MTKNCVICGKEIEVGSICQCCHAEIKMSKPDRDQLKRKQDEQKMIERAIKIREDENEG